MKNKRTSKKLLAGMLVISAIALVGCGKGNGKDIEALKTVNEVVDDNNFYPAEFTEEYNEGFIECSKEEMIEQTGIDTDAVDGCETVYYGILERVSGSKYVNMIFSYNSVVYNYNAAYTDEEGFINLTPYVINNSDKRTETYKEIEIITYKLAENSYIAGWTNKETGVTHNLRAASIEKETLLGVVKELIDQGK